MVRRKAVLASALEIATDALRFLFQSRQPFKVKRAVFTLRNVEERTVEIGFSRFGLRLRLRRGVLRKRPDVERRGGAEGGERENDDW